MLLEQIRLWIRSRIGFLKKRIKRNTHKVWEIRPLKGTAGENEARKILEEVARQVEPIMMKHKWKVKLLSQTFSKDEKLLRLNINNDNYLLLGLNINKGQEVLLCLRDDIENGKFFPFILIVDIMLHELCHNVHGRHNAGFQKLWDELRKEYEEFASKGIISASSEEFDLRGRHFAECFGQATADSESESDS